VVVFNLASDKQGCDQLLLHLNGRSFITEDIRVEQ